MPKFDNQETWIKQETMKTLNNNSHFQTYMKFIEKHMYQWPFFSLLVRHHIACCMYVNITILEMISNLNDKSSDDSCI